MANEIEAVIQRLQEKLRKQEAEATGTKKLINALCLEQGTPPPYADVDEPSSAAGFAPILPDRFHGQALASAVRDILQMRRRAHLGPASIEDIFEMLKRGGFIFEVSDDGLARRGVAISLGKNTAAFYRLPNGTWGLPEWYPEVRVEKKTRKRKATTDSKADSAGGTNDEEVDVNKLI